MIFAASLALAIAFQVAAGAYTAELGSLNPDEAPHYINGLLIARYAASGWGTPPMAFAAAFYRQYPKVSIGHWPPFFYVVEAAWMIVFSAARSSVMLLSAMITAGVAAMLGGLARRRHGWPAAAAGALFFLVLPLIREMTAALLVDVFAAGLELAAAVFMIRYVERPRCREAACFGVMAAAAIMTKGNGLALVLVPPFTILLTGRFRLLRRPSFWLPVPIVALCCAPWYVASYALARDGFFFDWGLDYSRLAVVANAGSLVQGLGIPCLLLAAAGAVLRSGEDMIHRRGLAALACAVFVFQGVVPVDVQSRYMIPAFAPLILLALAGSQGAFRPLMLAGCAASLLPGVLQIPSKPRIGMQEAARLVADVPVLIAAGAPGEGAFVVETALRRDADPPAVARGTKFLASADFDGGHYVARFATPGALAQAVRDAGFGAVVLDTSASSLRFPHNRMVQQAAASDHWRLVFRRGHDGVDGETLVYRIDGAPPAEARTACVWRPAGDADPASWISLRKPDLACR